jgi:hypothetical protein
LRVFCPGPAFLALPRILLEDLCLDLVFLTSSRNWFEAFFHGLLLVSLFEVLLDFILNNILYFILDFS